MVALMMAGRTKPKRGAAMAILLQIIGAFWAVAGLLVAAAALGAKMGFEVFLGGIGLGLFPGLVLLPLGHMSRQIEVLTQELASKQTVPP
jgi:hypothetical protein